MSEEWYETVDANVPITQGDLIFDCPLIHWQSKDIELQGDHSSEALKGSTEVISADVVVLTQACDLEYFKVNNVILCPHVSLGEYRASWEAEMRKKSQNPTDKAWSSHCGDICDGFVWNLAMLNSFETDEHTIDIRIVDFHEVYTVPRKFLESLLKVRNEQGYRLLPPYREHLSQAFARFFMRVGLPTEIKKAW
jgi:hypothetical protein